MARITIDTVLGGHSPTSHFGSKGQFRASIGIDPSQPINDADTATSTIASGLLRPAASQKFTGTTIGSPPLWIIPNPKDANTYVYDANGSAYTLDAAFTGATALADGGTLSSSLGNGAEYYDNYLYFAKNTDVARYGPLNGAAGFTGTYWVTGLSMTAMTNTAYPTSFLNGIQYPNHVMHRHSDGILYIADVVNNKGALHTIQTSFGSAEGDTNNGSTYYKLTFGYGLWPTALESYGADLAIALYEGNASGFKQQRAKLGFWDTTSANFNKITWVEFPDQIITAMKNVNGVLYVVSGNYNARGFRVTKFVGGYSFQEVWYSETGEPCLPGAIDATLNHVLYGSHTTVPESDGCVYATGLQKRELGGGFFNIMRSTGGNASTTVTAVSIADNNEMGFNVPIIGWTNGSGTANNGIDKQGTQYGNAPSVWWSPVYRIGAPFVINSVHIPFAGAMAANMIVTPKIYVDDGGSSTALQVLNNTTYPNSERSSKTLRNIGVRGEHSFWLELRWTGSSLLTISLPIIIDYDIVPD